MIPSGLASLPADLLSALRLLPTLIDRLDSIVASTAVLPEVRAGIGGIGTDTEALTGLREDMSRVADATAPLPEMASATDVLPAMYERMASIDSAMPVLVEVQQHLARLPETMESLQTRIGNLTDLMERLLQSLDRLDGNVTGLQESVNPLGRLADRLPGGKR